MNTSNPNENGKKFSPVFIFSSIIIFAIVLIGVFIPKQFGGFTSMITAWITNTLGWYYLILTTVIVFFCIF